MILLTLPVYNEEGILEINVKKIHNFMETNITAEDWKIVIVNNASTDKTPRIVHHLSQKLDKIEAVNLKEKGRGRALRYVWTNFNADIYAYCDIDLATDINHLPDLFNAIKAGNNLAVGSRYLTTSKIRRNLQRFLISKSCIFFIKLLNKSRITDFQCGFKALDKKTAQLVVSKTTDNGWFFDTELILMADRAGLTIKEIGVNWKENTDSSVNFIHDTVIFLKNLIKFKISQK